VALSGWAKKAVLAGIAVAVVLSVVGYFWHKSAKFEDAIGRALKAAEARDWKTAIAAVEEALEIYPDDPEALKLLERFRREERFDREMVAARTAIEKKDWERALRHAEEALRIHPGHEKARLLRDKARRHLDFEEAVSEAESHIEAGRLRRALAAYERALQSLKDEEVEKKVAALKARLAQYESAIREARGYEPLAELLPEIEAALDRAKGLWKKGPEVAELEALVARLRREAASEGPLVGIVPFVVEGVKIEGKKAAEIVRATLPKPFRGLPPENTSALLKEHNIVPERAEDIKKTHVLRLKHGLRFLLGGSIVRGPKAILLEGWLNNLREKRVHQRHSVEVHTVADIEPALRLLSALLFLNDEQKKAYLLWFEAAKKGEWEKAAASLREARRRWPAVPSFERALDDLTAMMWRRVETARKKGDWGVVARLCGFILALNPHHKNARQLLKTADEKVVEQVELAIDYEEARRLYEAAKLINPATEAEKVIEQAYRRLVARAKQALEDERFITVRLLVGYALKLKPGGEEAEGVARELNGRAADVLRDVCSALMRCDWEAVCRGVEVALKYLPDERLLKAARSLAEAPHKSFHKLASKPAHAASAEAVAFSPDSKTLATAGRDNTVRLFSVPDLKELTQVRLPAPVFSLSFSNDGKLLAAGCADGSVVLLKKENGLETFRTLKEHQDIVYAVAFDPKGRYLVSASSDNRICVWEKASGWDLMKVIREHTDAVRALAFSTDGKVLASGSADATVRLWSVEDGFLPLKVLSGKGGWVNAVAVSGDGVYVAGGGRDFLLFLWSLKEGDLVKGLKGHTNAITSLAFSPRGRYIASAGWDKKLVLWDRKERFVQVAKFEAHQQAVTDMAWSRSGRFLATVGRDGTLALWGVSRENLEGLIEKLQQLAAKLTGR